MIHFQMGDSNNLKYKKFSKTELFSVVNLSQHTHMTKTKMKMKN